MSSKMFPVKLAHFENPSLFYFRLEESYYNQLLKELESELQAVCANADRSFLPEVGEFLGIEHPSWNKWVRVKMESRSDKGLYRFFLLDYGHHFTSSSVKHFVKLPQNLCLDSPRIRCSSLDLMPADLVLDRKSGRRVLVPATYWSRKAMDIVQDLNKNRDNIIFNFKQKETRKNILIGDLVVTKKGETFNLSDRLIKERLAMRAGESNQAIVKVCEEPAKIEIKPESPLMLTAGATHGEGSGSSYEKNKAESKPDLRASNVTTFNNRSMLTKTTYESPKEANVKFQFAPKTSGNPPIKPPRAIQTPAPLPQEPKAAEPPTDVMLYAKRLCSPIASLQQVQFIKLIRDNVSSDFSSLQAHLWAHKSHSMVVVKNTTFDDTLKYTYLPMVLNAILSIREKRDLNAMGPVAVIITKSSSDVEKISKLCSQFAPGIDVVQVIGTSDKKVELMNGCDVLVTTPPAFCRLLIDVSVNLFDKERIKHLIFDGLDSFIQPFGTEIMRIIRCCTFMKSMPEKNPQVIVTSDVWVKQIKSIFLPMIPTTKLIVYIENFIEAAAYAECKFTMESCGNDEDKSKKLVKMLEEKTYAKHRTVVVAKDFKFANRLEEANVDFLVADKDNFEAVKREWLKQTSGISSILITNDLILDRMKLRNVEHLIHFDIPASWSVFSKRFAALLDHIYLHLQTRSETDSESCAPRSKIFIDEGSWVEVAELIRFVQSRGLATISVETLETIKELKLRNELEKCERNVKICDNVWSFGECQKHHCMYRHILNATDKPLPHLSMKSFIKFEIVAINSPTSFVIKIISHMIGGKWKSSNEKNREIEKVLEKDLQEFYKSHENQNVKDVKLGGVYATHTNDKWQRCKVIEKTSVDMFKVTYIDYGKSGPCRVANLFHLPQNFVNLEPLVCELQIMNIVPLDREEVWLEAMKKDVREMIDKLSEVTFTCRVQLAIGSVLFTDTFDARDNAVGCLKLRLKSKMLRTNMCVVDESVGEKLKKLAEVFMEREVKDQAKEEPKSIEQPKRKDQRKDMFVDDEPKGKPQEKWKQLSWQTAYDAYVKHFKNPESFFVVPDSADKRTLQKFLLEFENCTIEEKLQSIEVGTVCAVTHKDKLFRAKVMKINEDSADVLLVDSGEVVACAKSDLLELSSALISRFPFQTIHCRMVGVKPKFNMTTWPPKQCEVIKTLIESCEPPLKMFVMKSNSKKDELNQLGMYTYDVILINAKTGVHLDDIAVAKRFADRDEVEKPENCDDRINSGNNSQDEDVELLQKFLEKVLYSGDDDDEEEELKKDEKPERDQDQAENRKGLENPEDDAIPEAAVELKIVEEGDPPIVSEPSTLTALNFIYKQPKIEWRQNEACVYLQISAIDCESYELKVDKKSLAVTIKYNATTFEHATVNFYCDIEAKLTTHKLRGLNIIVYVVKKMFLNPSEWPRLTKTNERSHFINFSKEKVPLNVMEKQELPAPTGVSKYANCGPDFYDSDDEEGSNVQSDIEGLIEM